MSQHTNTGSNSSTDASASAGATVPSQPFVPTDTWAPISEGPNSSGDVNEVIDPNYSSGAYRFGQGGTAADTGTSFTFDSRSSNPLDSSNRRILLDTNSVKTEPVDSKPSSSVMGPPPPPGPHPRGGGKRQRTGQNTHTQISVDHKSSAQQASGHTQEYRDPDVAAGEAETALQWTNPHAQEIPLFPGMPGSVMLPIANPEEYEYLDGLKNRANPPGWTPMRTWPSRGGPSNHVKTETEVADPGSNKDNTEESDGDKQYEYLDGPRNQKDHLNWTPPW